jgi:phenylalanine-4-hydroxylase
MATNPERASIVFSIQDRVGALEAVLSALKPLEISLSGIESLPSKTKGVYDIFVNFSADPVKVKNALSEIEKIALAVKLTSSGDTDAGVGSVPWFPRKISDLDTFAGIN